MIGVGVAVLTYNNLTLEDSLMRKIIIFMTTSETLLRSMTTGDWKSVADKKLNQ
jgi:hypothetical protein